MKKFHHISGINGQFVKLEGRNHWLQTNDPEWRPKRADIGFSLNSEPLYALAAPEAPAQPDKLLRFREEAQAIARKKLDAMALAGVADSLRSAQAEYDLEKLIAAIDHHLQQDDLFK
ncbi:hypothetical protein LVJ83_06970 [Uruburuella testudinis]|uniref:Uncharacterized protein n=1 Tax=Uruburuella testudinis TaxID=1282863 RepID=A0ABY4DNU2_9NEIS|nr:hypothetical protein [Uruburuella testudinis]UOO80733.1 hypothetical protein LVJ83_06970 [Uruburuella testudinis]